jgi:hypothetical protein
MKTSQRHLRRRGMAMWMVAVSMGVGLAVASIAVDYGRVQIAKTQLRMAADAAARAGITQIGSTVSNVQDLAATMAVANKCDGTAIALDKVNDIQFLDWDTTTRTYTVLTGASQNNANAIKVTCRRVGTNGIPLNFAWMGGFSTCNANGSAIATLSPPKFGLVGLNYIKLSGNSTASYWSSTGVFAGNCGNIASNGNITSSINTTVKGAVWTLPGATISGITPYFRRTLSAPLSYPNGSALPYNMTNNDNGLLPNGMVGNGNNVTINNKTYNIPAGNYVVNSFALGANSQLNFLGPVTLYCYGNVTLTGQALTDSTVPQNLKIVMIPNPNNGAAPGSVSLTSGTPLYADIYAPQSALTVSGNGAIYGTVVAKSIDITGSGDIYYDLSVDPSAGAVKIVQ